MKEIVNTKLTKIALIGLGYVGLPLAMEFCKKIETIGFDTNKRRIRELKEGIEYLKGRIRKVGGGRKSILDGIPKRMPALQRAYKIQKKMASVGFDWESVEGAWKKLEEELKELKEAKDKKSIEEELGDVLQAIVNLARFYGVKPEDALHKSLDKSEKRFRYIEEKAREKGKNLKEMSLDEMDLYWEEAKRFDT